MTVRLDLNPDVEAGLLAQAKARGLPLEAYLEQVLRERSRSVDVARLSLMAFGNSLAFISARVRPGPSRFAG